jgi:3-phosphoshikimate 1-carboxyvinyltransferase
MSKRPERYPDSLEITPLTKPLGEKVVRVPGSKSITNRALVLAVLACRNDTHGVCFVDGILESEDTNVMIKSLRSLGFDIDGCNPRGHMIDGTFINKDEPFDVRSADLFVGNSGTSMRFLTALVTLGKGRFRLDGVPRMRERPIADLLDALQQLGVKAFAEHGNDRPPVIVEANGLPGGHVRIKGNLSSQFLSGLLMVAPMGKGDVTIEVDGPLVSVPYVDMTVAMMREFGASVHVESHSRFVIPGQQRYQRRHRYFIEPDASAASYWWGLAAITGGSITLPDLDRASLQGDVRFIEVLQQLGCRVETSPGAITVYGGPLHSIDVDMNDISDTVMTLAAVALFAEGPTTIRNVAHIRHKETDRLAALATELRRVGAEVEEFADGLRITPRPLHGAEIETYNDHRMAMSMALVGLKVPGIVIKNPECVAKTYPGFFADLEKLRC